MKGWGLGKVAPLSLITVFIGLVGERHQFTFGRGPAELAADLVGVFAIHTTLFSTKFAVVSLESVDKT